MTDTALGASATTFGDLPLHGDVSRALTAMRFLRPSPIQLHALPVALFGNDVIGQAKSGTGKTAVFGVAAVEHAIRFVEQRRQADETSETMGAGDPLVLILAPTREIAVQIEAVLRQLAQFRPEIVIRTCIGGLPVAQDQFISSAEDLENWKEREKALAPELWLRRVRQFYSVIKLSDTPVGADDVLNMKAKVVKLAALLSEILFEQCMVFCNDKFRAEALATALAAQGWPAACITGSQTQATRMEVMEDFRASRSRVLVSTDLTARGIDVDKVNFVVNLDLPRDPATYLHRVGRTGRFGGKGLAVTLLSKSEVQGVRLLARVFKMEISELPSPVPAEIYAYTAKEEHKPSDDQSLEAEELSDEVSAVGIACEVQEDEGGKESCQTAEHEVAANNLPIPSRYEREERSYETWLKLL
ncbi:unnamed protein product [Phytophthora fragariaefolia]|uniref:Unnamed protein product n=1 Tax=Phytophthora fragariaefolia TaxID=1490495 RepID=A0A9W6XPJ5_9STRA|nr:unnamed protein product [Phytophthora fragariaefolia]